MTSFQDAPDEAMEERSSRSNSTFIFKIQRFWNFIQYERTASRLICGSLLSPRAAMSQLLIYYWLLFSELHRAFHPAYKIAVDQ